MSYMKRWFDEHINDFTDEQLIDMGYGPQENIDFLRDALTGNKEREKKKEVREES